MQKTLAQVSSSASKGTDKGTTYGQEFIKLTGVSTADPGTAFDPSMMAHAGN